MQFYALLMYSHFSHTRPGLSIQFADVHIPENDVLSHNIKTISPRGWDETCSIYSLFMFRIASNVN